MDSTIVITFWITGVVYVVILLFMAYCVLRFRHRKGVKAAYNPENKKLEWWLTIVTAVGVAAMLAPGLVVWNDFITVPKDATTIEVLGQQWILADVGEVEPDEIFLVALDTLFRHPGPLVRHLPSDRAL